VLTLLSSKWFGTSFTPLVLTPVLSRLFAHMLVFEFKVGDLKNIWLIDSGCSRHMTGDKGWFSSLVPVVTMRCITFGDNGHGRVLSEGEIKVSDKITLRRVALVQSLGYNLLSVSQLLDEGFEVLFRPCLSIVPSMEEGRSASVATVILELHAVFFRPPSLPPCLACC
jgi:hypothetical protein